MNGFEKEILGLWRRLEIRTNRKTAGQVLKKSSCGGSRFERELCKLECFVSYKTNCFGRRKERKSSGELAEVCQ